MPQTVSHHRWHTAWPYIAFRTLNAVVLSRWIEGGWVVAFITLPYQPWVDDVRTDAQRVKRESLTAS